MDGETIRKLLTLGTFYCPASKHYGNNTPNVLCDRCRRQNLVCCIGFESKDLCMKCVLEMENNDIIPKIISGQTSQSSQQRPVFVATLMEQKQFAATRMEQRQFATNMKQRQFRPSPNSISNSSDDECPGELCTLMMQDQFDPFKLEDPMLPSSSRQPSPKPSSTSGACTKMMQEQYTPKDK